MSFINAAEAVQKQGQSLSDMQKLTLYGLFKQAKQGDCNTKRPGFFAMTDRAKWCVVSFLLYAMQVEGSPHTPTFVLLRRDVEAGAARRCSLVINGVPCRHFRPKVSSPSLFFIDLASGKSTSTHVLCYPLSPLNVSFGVCVGVASFPFFQTVHRAGITLNL